MKKCPKCNKEYEDTKTFCNDCGETLVEAKPKYHAVFKGITTAIVLIGVVGFIVMMIGSNMSYDHQNDIKLTLIETGGGIAIGAIVALFIEFFSWLYFIRTNPTAIAETQKEVEKKLADEAAKKAAFEESLKNIDESIDKTYIISTQTETVSATYMQAYGLGKLEKTVVDTTTFLVVFNIGGTRTTDKVPNDSPLYQIYIKHLDLSNPKIGGNS